MAENGDSDLLHERINIRGELERIHAKLEEREKQLDERWRSQEASVALAQQTFKYEHAREFVELQRRLDVLNNAHELAREKERDFISREVYVKHVERTSDDIKSLSNEIRRAAEPVALALIDQDKRNNERFGKVENTMAKLWGGLALAAFTLPILTTLLIYLIWHRK